MTFFLSGGFVDDDGILQIGKDNYMRYNANGKNGCFLDKMDEANF
jgi:hypothetical protein